jgi:hypothetical protein
MIVTVGARSRSKLLLDSAHHLIGAAWLDPSLRVQLADAWRWVFAESPEAAKAYDLWISQRERASA